MRFRLVFQEASSQRRILHFHLVQNALIIHMNDEKNAVLHDFCIYVDCRSKRLPELSFILFIRRPSVVIIITAVNDFRRTILSQNELITEIKTATMAKVAML